MSQDTEPNQPLHQQAIGDTSASGEEHPTTDLDLQIDQRLIIYNYYNPSQTQSASSPSREEPDRLPCPYRGLFHFGPKDAQFFFGRQHFIDQLYEATQTRNFIPILGTSGSGKSSVVLAGLVPKLQQEGGWQFTYFRPGAMGNKDQHKSADPWFALAQALVPLYTPNWNQTQQIKQSHQLADWLRSGEVLLPDVMGQISDCYPQSRLLLIADQFEELYTLCEDEATRRQFLDLLIDTICDRESDSPLVLVLTMGIDFLAHALSYPRFAQVLHSDMKLAAMSERQLREVIEKPAQQLGVEFEPDLVASILDDIEEPGNLSLLEEALTQLWKQRQGKQINFVAYQKMGGVKGALTRHADGVLSQWTLEEKQQVRSILMRLVNPGEETRGETRRPVIQRELSGYHRKFVTTLAAEGLVVTYKDGRGEETVEIVHEALIRYWGQFRTWVNENRERMGMAGQLERAAKEWDKRGRSEDDLLQGRRLREGKKFAAEYGDDYPLSERVTEWIQASVRQRWRNRFKLGWLVVIPMAMIWAIAEPRIRASRIEQAYNILESGSWAEKPKAARYLASGCRWPDRLVNLMPLLFGNCESLREANLSGANLSGINLRDANLSQANLSGANLSGSNLIDSTLSGANLSGSNLSQVDLTQATLSGATLSGADLSAATLVDSTLSGADLSGAYLSQANLSQANLIEANLIDTNLINTNLNGANLSGANLIEVNLWGANLSRANLSRTNLSQATLWQASLSGATLWGADLSETDFSGADLGGADFRDAYLRGADFRAEEKWGQVKHLTPEQVKLACGWQDVQFDPEFLQALNESGDPQEPPDCSRWE
ncbi:pentapeptide repeat-containing protein [Roseofilum sp. BLCC_M91]|uniref:Pentapeptide repeat-containing protein n=1 Tax=Roseofilum halophilum BLCC-M91 TaxID=3022259 RepID=A0ABT7BLN1_9CYAN|nr:pentapeptide repeat-containing protein [Roseofilum halophilum]MDJ1180103.1 pentapeptide repeat-containing protein [Roseofilum halophilum BLCC-M91]